MPTLSRIWPDCVLPAFIVAWLTWAVLAHPADRAPILGPVQGWRAPRAQSNLIAHMAYYGRDRGGYPADFQPIESFMRERGLTAAFAYTRCVGSFPMETLEEDGRFRHRLFTGESGDLERLAKLVKPLLSQPGDFVYIPSRSMTQFETRFFPGFDRLGFMLVMRPYPKQGPAPPDVLIQGYPDDVVVDEIDGLQVFRPATALQLPEEAQVVQGDGVTAWSSKKGSHLELKIKIDDPAPTPAPR